MPNVYKDLVEDAYKLEHHYKDMQDFEFTVQDGHLFMLQTRTAKRTAKAALHIAIDLAKERFAPRKKLLPRSMLVLWINCSTPLLSKRL